MTHTRGPWRYGHTLTDGLAVTAMEGLICVPILAIANENTANARLAAAAPELLDELKNAVQLLKQMGYSIDEGSAIHRFETTIWRATGGGE